MDSEGLEATASQPKPKPVSVSSAFPSLKRTRESPVPHHGAGAASAQQGSTVGSTPPLPSEDNETGFTRNGIKVGPRMPKLTGANKRVKSEDSPFPERSLQPKPPAMVTHTSTIAPSAHDTAVSAAGLPIDFSSNNAPMPLIYRASSTSSMASDLSSASAATNSRLENMSPVPEAFPPAPPSTPASARGRYALLDAGAATPLPFQSGVHNAANLEYQQYLADGVATPAPTQTTRASSKSTAAGSALPEDFSDWAVGDRYEMVRILGRGSYGEVAQAVDRHAGRPDAYVAIKRIQSPFEQQVDAVRLYREVHILRRMRGHECIIQLLDVVQPPSEDLDDFNDLYLVFEYVDTDLYKLIMSPQYLTTEHIQTFLYQMLTGLKYIHSFSCFHRDLKPANILLNEDCSLKICDFGLARIVETTTMSSSTVDGGTQQAEAMDVKAPISFGVAPKMGLTRQLTKHVVTRWYRAPELILIQPYTSAVDIWSLGCILAELLSMQDGNVPSYQDRKPLFPGGTCFPLSGEGDSIKKDERLDQLSVIFQVIGTPSPEDVASIGEANEYIQSLGKIERKPLETIYPAADPAAIDLLKTMLMFNPKQRCTAEEALEHDFFKGVRRKDLERVSATGPLEGPDFLENDDIDLQVLKQRTYDEVVWFRDHGASAGHPTEPSDIAN